MKNKIRLIWIYLQRKRQPIIASLLIFCIGGVFQNCKESGEFHAMEDALPVSSDIKKEIPIEPPKNLCEAGSKIICNPLGDGPAFRSTSVNGLIAELREGKTNWKHLDNYENGYAHPEKLLFSNFNVPVRSFKEGFSYGDGLVLKNQMGDQLLEWFSIVATGSIALPLDREAGEYHIVTLSDDGIRIKINGLEILSNPTTHAPQIDCAKSFIDLIPGEEKPFQLEYFQGPKYHIALMTWIKKIEPDSFSPPVICGKKGSAEEIAALGYEIISPEWFLLPPEYR